MREMSEADGIQSENTWITYLSKMLHLPKWCFRFLGYMTSSEEDKPPVEEVLSSTTDNPDELISVTEIESESSFPFLRFQGLINTLLSHFPATLTVGPLNQDLSIVSVVLLSAFIACLTSIFIIFISSIFCSKKLKEENNSGDDFKGKKRSHKSGITLASLATAKSNLTPQLSNQFIFDKDDTFKGDDVLRPNYSQKDFLDIGAGHLRILTLHQFPRGKYSPCFDMQGMKVETLLRLAHIPYEVVFDCSDTGPCITTETEAVWGSRCIMKFLEENYYHQMHLYIVPEDLKIQSHLISLHIENEICWLLYHWRWFFGVYNHENNFAWSKIPPEFTELAAASWNRKLGNVPIDILVEQLNESFNILSQILGDNVYFLDNCVSEVDISVFAVLSQAIWAMPTTTVEGLIMGKRNLVSLCNRIRDICWSDWDDQLWQGHHGNSDDDFLVHSAQTTGDFSTCNDSTDLRHLSESPGSWRETSEHANDDQTSAMQRARTKIFKNKDKLSTISYYFTPEIPHIQPAVRSQSQSEMFSKLPLCMHSEMDSGGELNVGTSFVNESDINEVVSELGCCMNLFPNSVELTELDASKSIRQPENLCITHYLNPNEFGFKSLNTSSSTEASEDEDSDFSNDFYNDNEVKIALIDDLLCNSNPHDQNMKLEQVIISQPEENDENTTVNNILKNTPSESTPTKCHNHGDHVSDLFLHVNNNSISDSMLQTNTKSKIPVRRTSTTKDLSNPAAVKSWTIYDPM